MRRPTARGTRRAIALAVLALSGFASPVACGPDRGSDIERSIDVIEDASDAARERVLEHEEYALTARDRAARLAIEREDAASMKALAKDMLDALYDVEGCSKEGRLRASVYLSDLLGQLESAVDAHLLVVDGAGSDEELASAESDHRAMIEAILDDIDVQASAGRAEAQSRGARACRLEPGATRRIPRR